MAKKITPGKPSQRAASIAVEPGQALHLIERADWLPLLFSALYLMVHFIPDMNAYDSFGPQWLYIIILDITGLAVLLTTQKLQPSHFSSVFGNLFSKTYLAYLLLAGISIFLSINPTEGWVCYARLIGTIVAFFNLSFLLYNRLHLFRVIAMVLSLILLIESIQTIHQFLTDVQNTDLSAVILSLKGQTGNKNIFAAGFVMKLPFAIYLIHTGRSLIKIVNACILTLAITTIVFLNARASYISLVLVFLFYIFLCLQLQFSEKKTSETITRLGFILIPLAISLLISQVELSSIKSIQNQAAGGYGTITERLGTVVSFNAENNQVRINLWQHAIDYTKKHPLMGCGYGNWKIASIPYQRFLTNDLIVPVHSHNDYLENFAELGIFGGLLYLLLFASITWFTFKTFFSGADTNSRMISLFSFMAFIGYSVDAFFNFPAERPLTQVFFALLCTINVLSYLETKNQGTGEQAEKENPESFKNKKAAYGLIASLLLLPSLYITYLTYRSLVVQRVVLADIMNEPLKMNVNEVLGMFPPIPNLCATGQPIEGIKGRYLSEAGRYDEALALLDKGRIANPVIGYSEFLKAGLYFKQNKMDSAFRNAMYAYEVRPRANTYFQTLIAVLAKRGDTVNIKKAFETYNTYRKEIFGWNLYILGLWNAKGNKGDAHLLALADSSIKLFKDDPGVSLLKTRRTEIQNSMMSAAVGNISNTAIEQSNKLYGDAVASFGAGVKGKNDLPKAGALFLKAYNLNPGNWVALENAAISYFNNQDWQKSILLFEKEIALNISVTGKPEYFLGVAMINTQQKAKGCGLLKTASTKGWKDADGIMKQAGCQ